MKEKIGVGIVGCGRIARDAHIPAFRKLPDVRIVAAVDRDIHRAKMFASRNSIPFVYSDYEQLIARSDIQLIDICTPPSDHARIAIDAARSGKHVLVEKPMALTLESAQEIVSLAEREQVKVGVVHNYRFLPCIEKIRDYINQGNLGRIVSAFAFFHSTSISSASYLGDPNSGGILFEFATHPVDLLTYLLGDVESVMAICSDPAESFGFPVHATIFLRMSDESHAVVDTSYVAGESDNRLKLIGTGSIATADLRYDLQSLEYQTQTPVSQQLDLLRDYLSIAKGVMTGEYWKRIDSHYRFISKFISCLSTEDPSPVSEKDGLRVTRILVAAQKSLASSSWEVVPR